MVLEPEYCLVIFSAIGSCNRPSKATVKRTTKRRAAWFVSYVGHFTTHVQTCLTTNRVCVRSCVNTDFWLDTITRKSRYTRDLRHLLQNKFDKSQLDVQHVQILLQKQIELFSTFCNNFAFLQQPDFLQDRFDPWVVKCPTYEANQAARFFVVRFNYRSFRWSITGADCRKNDYRYTVLWFKSHGFSSRSP